MTSTQRRESRLWQFREAMRSFAARHLDDYVAGLPTRTPPSPKEFNDPVWGTILASPAEVVVIDSPLFQRLQEISQLGVAHLIFRSANHTRFEHSLGALHAMSVLIRECNETVSDQLRHDPEQADLLRDPIPTESAGLLRLAALLHDVGHGFMSHVSEKAFKSSDWALDLANEISVDEDEFAKLPDDVHLSELAAYFIVTSEACRDLFQYLNNHFGIGEPAHVADVVSHAILGLPIDNVRPFLTELLSGPFDVDKLDYISRDAFMCGVPNVIDINRLIRKLRTTLSRRDQLPQRVAERLDKSVDHYLVTGIARSGARTLDELALARSLLTDKVYRHQKVRAYESLLASIILLLSELSDDPMEIMWCVTDIDLMAAATEHLAERCGISMKTVTSARKLRLVGKLRTMYRERSDYVSAYTWTGGQTDLEILDADVQISGINQLREEVRRTSDRQILALDIAKTIATMCKTVGLAPPIVETSSDLQYLVQIDPVDERSQNRGRALISRAFLIGKSGSVVQFNSEYPDTEDWSDLYVVNREASAVFGPRELAPLIYLATEQVFFTRFGIRTTDRMRQDAHIDWEKVVGLRRQLDKEGYYGGKLRPLAPFPKVLDRPSSKNTIDAIVSKFRRYQGPGLEGRAGASDVTEVLIREFVRQMPDDSLVEPMLKVIQEVKFVDRESFALAVRRGLEKVDVDPSKTVYSVLGDPDESSGAVTYLVKNVLADRGISVDRIDSAADASKDTLVLVDDFVGLGTRCSGIIRSWLGEVPGEKPLTSSGQEWLRRTRIVLIFAAGLPGAQKRVNEAFKGTDLGDPDVYVSDEQIPTLGDAVAGLSRAKGEQLIKFLRESGEELLRYTKGYGPKMAAANALGYGNHGLLLAFPFSTPKQTVTALWTSGMTKAGQWQALFPRPD